HQLPVSESDADAELNPLRGDRDIRVDVLRTWRNPAPAVAAVDDVALEERAADAYRDADEGLGEAVGEVVAELDGRDAQRRDATRQLRRDVRATDDEVDLGLNLGGAGCKPDIRTKRVDHRRQDVFHANGGEGGFLHGARAPPDEVGNPLRARIEIVGA